jgi:hypothetical protein
LVRGHEVGGCSLDLDLIHGTRELRDSNAQEDARHCKNQHELGKGKGSLHGAE